MLIKITSIHVIIESTECIYYHVNILCIMYVSTVCISTSLAISWLTYKTTSIPIIIWHPTNITHRHVKTINISKSKITRLIKKCHSSSNEGRRTFIISTRELRATLYRHDTIYARKCFSDDSFFLFPNFMTNCFFLLN